ncbi:hypothetical protein YC2023_071951 [Brassica napus]
MTTSQCPVELLLRRGHQEGKTNLSHYSLNPDHVPYWWVNNPTLGSIGHAFTVRIRTENQNQTSFYPFVPHEISVLVELVLGHLRYLFTDVPPQPNSPPGNVLLPDLPTEASLGSKRRGCYPAPDSQRK